MPKPRSLPSVCWLMFSAALSACQCQSKHAPITDAGVDAGTPDAGIDAGAPDAGPGAPTKLDIVFVVANDPGMFDKLPLLAQAVPDLLDGLLNPACLTDAGTPVSSASQPGPTGACPTGSTRDFPPPTDVHIGVISTSLGSYGADGCPDSTTSTCPNGATTTANNDHAHLLSRADPCTGASVPTYQNEGFLAWDPKGELSPPGEEQLGDLGSGTGLVSALYDIIVGVGTNGCGFAAQDEAWYRFLADPSPYQSISLNGETVSTSGTDTTLLQERQEFLRPDSLLVVIDFTHKTDGSIKEDSFYPLFAQEVENEQPFHLPHASSACTTGGPLDPCCYSCGQSPPSGCTADPTCTSSPDYTDADENIAIRAFGLESHKVRYGIEFFYPQSRYSDALTQPTITNETGQTVANPIFAGGRPASWVLYTAIVGVPWQLIARQYEGQPDLVYGVSALDPSAIGGFKTSAELDLMDPHGNTFWDDIAGNPTQYVQPLSPFMQEATAPRSGTDPITGTAISPPTSPNGTNPLNGHEWDIAQPPGDLEYACTFPEPEAIDCSQAGVPCDCSSGTSDDSPLCDPNPNDNMNLSLQTSGAAYPGVKELALAKALGPQGVVASICPKQVTDDTQPDYGYTPAMQTIIDRIRPILRGE